MKMSCFIPFPITLFKTRTARYLLAILTAMSFNCPASEGLPHIKVIKIIKSGRAPHQIAFSTDGATAYIAAAGSDRIDEIDTRALSWKSAIAASQVPLGVAVTPANKLLTSRFHDSHISLINRYGEPLGKALNVGGAPSLFTPLGNDRWLIVSEKSNRLTVVSGDPFQELARYPTGARPFPAAATRDGGKAFVPNYNDGTVTIIDLTRQHVVETIKVGDRPSGGAVIPNPFGPDHYYAVAVRGENRIALVNTRTHQVDGEIRAGIGKSPFSVITHPEKKLAFVNNTASHDISIIDLNTMKVSKRLKTGEIPIVMALSPDGGQLWVACEGTHDIYVIDLVTNIDSDKRTTPKEQQMNAHEPRFNQAIQEIRELHFFFQEWMNGRLEQTDTAFNRFEQVMAEDLVFVSPEGHIINRQNLIEGLWNTHHRFMQENGGDIRIWTENEQVRQFDDQLYLATYQEHQRHDGKNRVRLSSVLFRYHDDKPNKLEWVHVHETWRNNN